MRKLRESTDAGEFFAYLKSFSEELEVMRGSLEREVNTALTPMEGLVNTAPLKEALVGYYALLGEFARTVRLTAKDIGKP